MKIFSFTGPKGSGKDASAAILISENLAEGKISFAGPMKQILSKLCKIPISTFEDPALKEKRFIDPIILTADLIDNIVREMNDILKDEFIDGEAIDIKGIAWEMLMTPRHLLQFVGTELIRKRINPDWHVAAAFRKEVLADLNPDAAFCVTDARFPNEYLWLKNKFASDFQGFYTERPEAEELLKTATHESELAVIEVRALMTEEQIIKNNGSLEDLKQLILTKTKG